MARTLVKHDPLTEAAWYALSPFINPIDCSKRLILPAADGTPTPLVIPLNVNDALNAVYNGEGEAIKPSFFSKQCLAAHLTGRETYYYRSRPNGCVREGYGSHAAAHLKLNFDSARFGIFGKAHRYRQAGVMLLCVDIDCHQGERDVAKVRDWLLKEYFPGSYWEPSTSGKGVHLYLKLAFNPWHRKWRDVTLQYVVQTVQSLSVILDQERRRLGLDAPVDKLAGLPSLFAADGSRVRVCRSRCIKVPRFSQGIQDVQAFHFAPFCLFASIERLVADWHQRESAGIASSLDANGDEHVRQVLEIEVGEGKLSSLRLNCGGEVSLNSAYHTYAAQLQRLREMPDAYERGLGFCLAYSRELRRVPSVNEALSEYEAQRLNTGEDKDGHRRRRIEGLLQFVGQTFDVAKASRGIDYSGFEHAKPQLLAELRQRLTPDVRLQYAVTKTRRASVGLEDLAVLLFAMRQSRGSNPTTAFSYAQSKAAFQAIMRKGCARNKAAVLFAALETMKFIGRAGGYQVGRKGRDWSVC